MELQIANLWEAKRWLIGWGGSAEVVEPKVLQEEVERECKSVLQRGR
jgi:predicted DNA-binding transcriptional regulator YafY